MGFKVPNYCLLFPGQGSQYVGMAESFLKDEDFENILGFSLKKLMLFGPSEELMKTCNAQPAILLHSVLAFSFLKKAKPQITFCAGIGHSLGEYSALVCANVLSLEDALKTVFLRGQLMQKAVPKNCGKMAAILGLDPKEIEEALKEFQDENKEDYAKVANFNGPAQTVISGSARGVEKAILKLKALGAKKAIELMVSAPFHCALMKPAQDELLFQIDSLKFNEPTFSIISTSKAKVLNTAFEIKESIKEQITNPVRFTQSIMLAKEKNLIKDGFLEIGPGQVLSKIVKRIDPGILIKNIDKAEDIQNV